MLTSDRKVLTPILCVAIHIFKLRRWGQGSERKGEGQYQQQWRTRSKTIHFTLKIMHIIGQNKSLWDQLTSGKSAPNCR